MITNILINSSTARITTNGNNQNLSFNIDVPPIEIRKSAILKVSNFCHIGTATGHTDIIYLFKIRGINVNNSKFLYNVDGNPPILATTFNNNRSTYEENELTLNKQTINNIDIIIDSISSSGNVIGAYSTTAGSGYVKNQIFTPTTTGGGGTINGTILQISSITSAGGIDTCKLYRDILGTGTLYSSVPTAMSYGTFNGFDAVLTPVMLSNSVNSITIVNGGFGYKVGQGLTFTGGGGTGANYSIATTNSEGTILTLTKTSGGTGYTTAPVITGTALTLTGATILPIMKFGTIVSGIPNTLNFCISLRIEENSDE
jgi:hypothetical protein